MNAGGACDAAADCPSGTCPDGTISGLTFGGSTAADGVTVIAGDKCIASAASAGDFPVTNVLIDHCRFYGADAPYTSWGDAKDLPRPAEKQRGMSGVDVRKGGHDWEIRYSHFRGLVDAIGTGNNCEFNTYAHHNRIENLKDDAFETEADPIAFSDAPGCRYCSGGSNAGAPCPLGNECTGGTCGIASFIGQFDAYENYLGNVLICNALGQGSSTMRGVCSGGTKAGFLCDLAADCPSGTCKRDHHYYRNTCVKVREPFINRKGKPTSSEGVRTFNGGWRYGSQYAFKSKEFSIAALDLPTIFYDHNTIVLSTAGSLGLHVVPKSPFGTTADTWTDSNLFVIVNGPAQGVIPSYTGQHLDYDLYYRFNGFDGSYLLDTRNTVAAECSARGYECNGVGSTSKIGTNPVFSGYPGVFDKTVPSRWASWPSLEVFTPQSFQVDVTSPAINAANPSIVDPRAGHGNLPDSRASHADIGAIPFALSGPPPSALDTDPARAE